MIEYLVWYMVDYQFFVVLVINGYLENYAFRINPFNFVFSYLIGQYIVINL